MSSIGVAVLVWGLAAFPIVWTVTKGLEWQPLRRGIEVVGIGTLWLLPSVDTQNRQLIDR
jgi:hypothetical protein